MKIHIFGNGFDAFDVSEDFQGVTTFDTCHSGRVRVKNICDIHINHDGSIQLLCDLRDGDPRKSKVGAVPDQPEIVAEVPV